MEVWDEEAVEAGLLDNIARVALDVVGPIGLADEAPVVRWIE